MYAVRVHIPTGTLKHIIMMLPTSVFFMVKCTLLWNANQCHSFVMVGWQVLCQLVQSSGFSDG